MRSLEPLLPDTGHAPRLEIHGAYSNRSSSHVSLLLAIRLHRQRKLRRWNAQPSSITRTRARLIFDFNVMLLSPRVDGILDQFPSPPRRAARSPHRSAMRLTHSWRGCWIRLARHAAVIAQGPDGSPFGRGDNNFSPCPFTSLLLSHPVGCVLDRLTGEKWAPPDNPDCIPFAFSLGPLLRTDSWICRFDRSSAR